MKVIKSEIVHLGKFIRVRVDTVEDDLKKIVMREVTESVEGVFVIAITPDQKIVLIKQLRHNHNYIYELPAGTVDEGSTPLETAQRELLEETGITAKKWQLVSKHHNGVHDEGYNYFFIAKDLEFGKSSQMDDEQIEPFEVFTFAEADRLIEENKIVDLRNRAAIWLAELLLLKNK